PRQSRRGQQMNNAGSLNSQLIELLDDFGVRSVTDYYALAPGEQPYFVKRLYKTLVRGLDQTVRAAKSDEGVKFHFQTSGSLARSPNVPTATFLKKLSFYANRTIVSFPFRELTREEQAHLIHSRNKGERDSLFYFGDFTTHRTSRGGRVQKLGKLYTVDTQAFRDLLTVITRLRPAMEADVSCVVSTFPDNKNVLRNRRLGLTSANFKQRELERQFWEESSVRADEERTPTALSHLLLPH